MTRRTLFKTLLGLAGLSALPKATTIASDTSFLALKEKMREEIFGYDFGSDGITCFVPYSQTYDPTACDVPVETIPTDFGELRMVRHPLLFDDLK